MYTHDEWAQWLCFSQLNISDYTRKPVTINHSLLMSISLQLQITNVFSFPQFLFQISNEISPITFASNYTSSQLILMIIQSSVSMKMSRPEWFPFWVNLKYMNIKQIINCTQWSIMCVQTHMDSYKDRIGWVLPYRLPYPDDEWP